jgi:hypothetical protein
MFLARKSLVSDIPAGDGNIEKFFYGAVNAFYGKNGSHFSGPIFLFKIEKDQQNLLTKRV